MSSQLSHSQTSFEKKEFPVILLLDNVTGEANIGSLFRLADAFGIEKIVFCGSNPNLNSNRLKRTARNTHKTVKFEFFESTSEAIQIFKNEGYTCLGLEITATSSPLNSFDLENSEKIILIAGNERHGIDAQSLELCHRTHHIEMYGENSSMNVAQSVGIALYEITKAFNKFQKK